MQDCFTFLCVLSFTCTRLRSQTRTNARKETAVATASANVSTRWTAWHVAIAQLVGITMAIRAAKVCLCLLVDCFVEIPQHSQLSQKPVFLFGQQMIRCDYLLLCTCCIFVNVYLNYLNVNVTRLSYFETLVYIVIHLRFSKSHDQPPRQKRVTIDD